MYQVMKMDDICTFIAVGMPGIRIKAQYKKETAAWRAFQKFAVKYGQQAVAMQR
jgi:hypothetical protein